MPKRSEGSTNHPITLFSMILRRGKKHKLTQAVEKRTYMNQYMKKYFRTVSDNVLKLNEYNRAKKRRREEKRTFNRFKVFKRRLDFNRRICEKL